MLFETWGFLLCRITFRAVRSSTMIQFAPKELIIVLFGRRPSRGQSRTARVKRPESKPVKFAPLRCSQVLTRAQRGKWPPLKYQRWSAEFEKLLLGMPYESFIILNISIALAPCATINGVITLRLSEGSWGNTDSIRCRVCWWQALITSKVEPVGSIFIWLGCPLTFISDNVTLFLKKGQQLFKFRLTFRAVRSLVVVQYARSAYNYQIWAKAEPRPKPYSPC